MMDRTFHLEWNNYLPNMQVLLETFYSHQNLVDVTLSCCDGILKAHKIILSACSPYFEHIFRENPCKHPIVILKGISVREMQALLKFMYKGSVDIPEADLSSLVHTASEFKVKGFASENSNASNTKNRLGESGKYTEHNQTKSALDILNQSNLICEEKSKTTESDPKNQSLEDDANVKNKSLTPRIVNSQSLKDGNEHLHSGENNEDQCKLDAAKDSDSTVEERSTPYPRDTRFKGRKRVAVGLRLNTRTRSVEKREHDSKSTSSDKRDQDILAATGLVKKFKSNTNNKNDSEVESRIENGKGSNASDVSYKAGTERSPDADESSRFMKLVPDIDIKEEQEDPNLYCIQTLREQGEYSEHTDEDRNVKVEESTEDPGDTVCSYCYLDCHTSVELKKHLRSHNTGERPHECEFCELAFARASHLARHRRVHTGERPFTCPSCGRRFSRQDKLKQHIKRHHEEDSSHLHSSLTEASKQHSEVVQHYSELQPPVLRRARGRPRKNRKVGDVPGSTDGNISSFINSPAEASNISLPFGDTSYLSSLSLGQQRYNDLTISPVVESSSGGPSTSQNAHAEDLLKSVRQLGECTIQAFPGQAQAE